MKNNNQYDDAPEDVRKGLETVRQIKDFLPPPEQLILKEKKVTIVLSQKSMEFFKNKSKITP